MAAVWYKNKWFTLSLKILFGILVLYIVFNQSEERFAAIKENIKEANLWFLLAALLMYHISVYFSVHRLQFTLKDYKLQLSFGENYSLYYLGMFLNLFLPGGIGGDAYKGYIIAKRNQSSAKSIIMTLVWDRFIGLAAMLFLAFLLILFINPFHLINNQVQLIKWISFTLLVLVIPITYYILRLMKSKIKASYLIIFLSAIGVQGSQLLCAFFILQAFGVDAPSLAYFVLFLFSSIMTIIPITFGGIGLRELCFNSPYTEQWFDINNNIGISLTLCFFLITVFASLPGIIPFLRERKGLSSAQNEN